MSRTSKLDARLSASCAQFTPTASHFDAIKATDSTPPVDRILRLPEVLQMVSIGRTTLYMMLKNGTFPAPLHLSARIRGWRLSTIHQFLLAVEARNENQ
ncbi:helix-turn-helix transcriptional regulator [Paraburkholderia sp. XV]|uniref:helix-turn-helix transcriptional regulator n=1 Tax=Paraburkholderia sp. XV TaxID=2831520 RepID=UPI001CD1ECF9|nr:AlpA family phage regulatory protein [Paraburkholderia sp. XV]